MKVKVFNSIVIATMCFVIAVTTFNHTNSNVSKEYFTTWAYTNRNVCLKHYPSPLSPCKIVIPMGKIVGLVNMEPRNKFYRVVYFRNNIAYAGWIYYTSFYFVYA